MEEQPKIDLCFEVIHDSRQNKCLLSANNSLIFKDALDSLSGRFLESFTLLWRRSAAKSFVLVVFQKTLNS